MEKLELEFVKRQHPYLTIRQFLDANSLELVKSCNDKIIAKHIVLVDDKFQFNKHNTD